MTKRTKLIIAVAVGVAAIGTGVGVGLAADGDDRSLTGTTYDRATSAALEQVDGIVIETEVGDDGEAAYEVEIRRADGTQVEVWLDAGFEVLGTESDDDRAKDSDEARDDD
ncbi:MAG: PepSY domain-containing protein [Actinomycetota bacterium]|nr:PepSY domain-containing protein [Actinomycetota bacterium]